MTSMKNHLNRRLTLLGALLGAGVALAPAAARAQSLRPNILIVFDTSGSMLRSDTDDGSPLCAGSGTSSRIYNLKKALREALAQVGTDEANFGLMRYAQIENPTATPACPTGHYANNNTTAVGGRNGCRLPTDTATTNATTGSELAYGSWFDNGYRGALVVDVTKRPAGVKPVAGDFDPTDGNVSTVYRWIDQTEDTDNVAPTVDPELRAGNQWYTPIGRSLYYARIYFDNFVKPLDPRTCRTNLVIFVTDGDETCDDTNGSANLDPATCIKTGASLYHPEVQACKLFKNSNVKTYVLTDTSTSAANDRIATAGGTTSIRVTLTDSAAVKAALVGIIASTVQPAEICNGADDNCNNQIDEGVKNNCPLDLATLKHCAVESCNCADDDCDGQIDEGFAPNACGGPGCCAVPTEICDGIDNDCDGSIDEGFDVGASCTNNGVGACRRGGVKACNAAHNGTFCDAPTVTPTPEVCNNIDDDCNGLVDDGGTIPGVGERCGNNLGMCQSGTFVCMNGRLTCNSVTTPGVEVCNGIDDNCDGAIDNGTFPQVGQSCVCAGLDPALVGVGECKAGKIACKGNLGLVCDGCTGPTPEICDGKDNDCDGMADKQATCPSGFGCREGQCTITCANSEFACPSGYKCVNDFCIPQRCAQVTCQSGQRCDENTGTCVDLCAGVACTSPKVCIQGRCLDCESPQLACNPGQICFGGVCKSDACEGVTCGNGQYCQDGACVDTCIPGKCGSGTRCVAGACIPDACGSVACPLGQYCDPANGQCKTNSCDVLQCPAGERCVPTTGACIPDPCRLIDCPTDCWTCGITNEGTGTCLLKPQCQQTITRVGQSGGGKAALSCSVGDGDGVSVIGLLFGAGLLARARARVRARSRRRSATSGGDAL